MCASVLSKRRKYATYLRHDSLNVKAFQDDSGAYWKTNVVDRGGEILCVSQFTLFAKLNKNKPDFHNSMVSYYERGEGTDGDS